MSRSNPSPVTVEKWIKDLPELEFDGIQLRCKICNVLLSWQVKTRVLKHVSSDTHKARLTGSATAFERQKAFNKDLLKVLVACNIPWNTVNNPKFTQFLQNCADGKYTDLCVSELNIITHDIKRDETELSSDGDRPLTGPKINVKEKEHCAIPIQDWCAVEIHENKKTED